MAVEHFQEKTRQRLIGRPHMRRVILQKILSPPARQPKPQRQAAPQAVEAAAEPAASQPEPAKPAGASTEAASPPQDSDPVAASEAPVAQVDPPLLATAAAAAQPSVPASSDSPTIRERAQLRERRRQAATSSHTPSSASPITAHS